MPARSELGDPLDRGLERVGERELGDRLADDRHERLRAPEREGDEADPAAAPESERGAGHEGRQQLELVFARARRPRRRAGGRRGGRLAERERDRAPRRPPLPPRPGLRRARADALGPTERSGGRPPKPCTERSDRGTRPSIRQRAAPAASVASTASRTTCSAVSVSSAPAASTSPRSSREACVSSGFPLGPTRAARSARAATARCAAAARARARSRSEKGRPEPEKLQRGHDLAVRFDGHDEDRRRTCARGCTAERGRRRGIARCGCEHELLRPQLRRREPRSFELRGERRRLGVDRARYEGLASRVAEAREPDLRPGGDGDGAHEREQRAIELLAANELERRRGERAERVLLRRRQRRPGLLQRIGGAPHGCIMASRRPRPESLSACGSRPERQESRAMAAPAPRRVSVDAPRPDAPPTDPRDLQRALRRERARRQCAARARA